MGERRGYRVEPFDASRRMVAASAAVGRGRNIIHTLTEVDIVEPRRRIRAHRERTGESLSLTAYVVACLARTVAEHPELNAMRRGGRLFILDEVVVSVLVERAIGVRRVPEPLAVRAADRKSHGQIQAEIRAAQGRGGEPLGALSGAARLVRLIPPPLLTAFVWAASRSVTMARRYGVVAVTAVGMYGPGPLWAVPLSAATITVTVGGIVARPAVVDGRVEAREHLCLTLSFDHDLVDGAPAARFTGALGRWLSSGSLLVGGESAGA